MIRVRPEMPADRAGISRIHEAAFETDVEARLVEALRETEASVVSLVAEASDELVGHVVFSPVVIESPTGRTGAIGLGPMAVVPEQQRRGIGTRLVEEGLAACQAARHRLVFVLGHPSFYRRCGFVPAPPRGLHYSSHELDPYFMLRELEPGAAGTVSGWVRYDPAFEAV